MGLSKYEQETVINYNNGEKTATLYTADPIVMRKMDKLVEKDPDEYKVIKENDISKTYEFPKKLIGFRVTQRMTPEQREKAIARLKKFNKNIKNDEKSVDK